MRVKPYLTGFVIVLAILTAAGIILFKLAVDRYHKEQVIFEMSDPVGDDYGPGKYKYPIDSIFDPKKGHFDLRKFTFSRQEKNYLFDMELGLVTNPWGAPEGFSHPIIEIYISTDSDSGKIETFREGANVNFSPERPWKYMVKVVSFNKTAVFNSTDYAGSEGESKGIRAFLAEDKKTIRVRVPRNYLPGDPKNWMFYVLVGSQDGNGPDNFRRVRANIGQYNFGGGTDTNYSPNVIDLLAPAGGEHSQEVMLKSFNAAKRRLAFIYPVGPTGYSPSLWEQLLDRVAVLGDKWDAKL